MGKKLSVLLGLRDKTEKTYDGMVNDMVSKFTNKQNLFKGHKKTYEALEGFADDPTKRSYVRVSSTVREQLEWFKEHVKDHLGVVLSIEKTNAEGPKAALVVGEENWGEFTTLELLRLKSVLDGKVRTMLQQLPVRSESVLWSKTTEENHKSREVYETPLDSGFTKTTLKDTVIVNDPHIKDAENRPPVTKETSMQVNTGKYSSQDFSGELSMEERAKILVKYDRLHTAIIEALENANNIEASESALGEKVLSYLF